MRFCLVSLAISCFAERHPLTSEGRRCVNAKDGRAPISAQRGFPGRSYTAAEDCRTPKRSPRGCVQVLRRGSTTNLIDTICPPYICLCYPDAITSTMDIG